MIDWAPLWAFRTTHATCPTARRAPARRTFERDPHRAPGNWLPDGIFGLFPTWRFTTPARVGGLGSACFAAQTWKVFLQKILALNKLELGQESISRTRVSHAREFRIAPYARREDRTPALACSSRPSAPAAGTRAQRCPSRRVHARRARALPPDRRLSTAPGPCAARVYAAATGRPRSCATPGRSGTRWTSVDRDHCTPGRCA